RPRHCFNFRRSACLKGRVCMQRKTLREKLQEASCKLREKLQGASNHDIAAGEATRGKQP
ncbi:MAG: hypothetical protein AAGD28_00565, partial [Bacteroidota bacterium]